MPARPTLDLSLSAQSGSAYLPFLREYIAKAHAILNPPLRELSLALVASRTMASLHWRYMAIEGPTDVLTFELDYDQQGHVIAGEVVVCVPYARATAKQIGVPLEHELLLYAVHGMLHLCGFDDRTDRQFKRMHRREDEILSQLGIGRVFAPAARSARTPARGRAGKPAARSKHRRDSLRGAAEHAHFPGGKTKRARS